MLHKTVVQVCSIGPTVNRVFADLVAKLVAMVLDHNPQVPAPDHASPAIIVQLLRPVPPKTLALVCCVLCAVCCVLCAVCCHLPSAVCRLPSALCPLNAGLVWSVDTCRFAVQPDAMAWPLNLPPLARDRAARATIAL